MSGLENLLAKSEKELKKIQEKIGRGEDLKKEEATLALINALFPYTNEKIEILSTSVTSLSSSVQTLKDDFSEKASQLLEDVRKWQSRARARYSKGKARIH